MWECKYEEFDLLVGECSTDENRCMASHPVLVDEMDTMSTGGLHPLFGLDLTLRGENETW